MLKTGCCYRVAHERPESRPWMSLGCDGKRSSWNLRSPGIQTGPLKKKEQRHRRTNCIEKVGGYKLSKWGGFICPLRAPF